MSPTDRNFHFLSLGLFGGMLISLGISKIIRLYYLYQTILASDISYYIKTQDDGLDKEMSDLAVNYRSLHCYQKITLQLFIDGVVSYGRLVALTLFTQKVCYKTPNISHQIRNHYMRVITHLRLCQHKPKAKKMTTPRNGV